MPKPEELIDGYTNVIKETSVNFANLTIIKESLYEKLYVFSGSKKKEKVSEIYLKLTKMKINCLKKKEIEPLFKTKETEMLYILKELESTYYYERDKVM